MATRLFIFGLAVVLLMPQTCPAQGKAKVARAAAEYVMRKFGKKAAEEGVETLYRKLKHSRSSMATRRSSPLGRSGHAHFVLSKRQVNTVYNR